MQIMYLPLNCFSVGLVWTSVVANNITPTTQGDSSSEDYSTSTDYSGIINASSMSNISLNISRTIETNETTNTSSNNTGITPTPDYSNSEFPDHKHVIYLTLRSHSFTVS